MTPSVPTKKQEIVIPWMKYRENEERHRIRAFLRYDDRCGNGHNTFSITGETQWVQNNYWVEGSGGCIHEEIAKRLPHLSDLIKWHLVSSDGPMHYIANTLYHLSDKCSLGKRKGEPCIFCTCIQFDNPPITYEPSTRLLEYIHKAGSEHVWGSERLIELTYAGDYKLPSKYTLSGMYFEGIKWHQGCFDDLSEGEKFLQGMQNCKVKLVTEVVRYSEGKEPDLEAARRSAIWPEATDEQLRLPEEQVKELLLARLPKLMEDFRKEMEGLGFVY